MYTIFYFNLFSFLSLCIGIYTLSDLEMSNETILSHHGFTRLMARRLYRSLYEYYQDDDDGGETSNFMTNPNTSIKSAKKNYSRKFSASPQLKNSVNYGKQNKRRVQNIKQMANSASSDSLKRSGSPIGRKISVTPPVSYKPTVIGTSPINAIDGEKTTPPLPSPVPETLEVDVVHEDETITDVEVMYPVEPLSEEDQTLLEEIGDDELPAVVVESPTLDPIQSEGMSRTPANVIFQQSPIPIDHHLSMPMGLDRIHGNETPLEPAGLFTNDRSLSCPCLAMLVDDTVPEVEDKEVNDFNQILLALQNHEVRDVEELLMYLHAILDILKTSCLASVENAFEVIIDIITRHLHNLVVVEVSCRVIRYLTTNIAHNYSSNGVLEKVVLAVLNVIKAHPLSKKCQLNGCLTINNLFRSGTNGHRQ